MTSARPVRVLRWTFRRQDEVLHCELGLDRQELAYELRVRPPDAVDGSVETFTDAIAAFTRQAALERSLVQDGWSLESFQTDSLMADSHA
jgi:hypothetical protein